MRHFSDRIVVAASCKAGSVNEMEIARRCAEAMYDADGPLISEYRGRSRSVGGSLVGSDGLSGG